MHTKTVRSLAVLFAFASTCVAGRAAAFDAMSASFGLTKTLIGVHHATTTNPDGASINFWDPAFEGQPATSVSLSNPHNAGADAYGNVYIADKAGHAILKITTDGLVHTFAGTHVAGFNGDGPALANTLQIFSPNGLFVLPNGVVYVLDPDNHRIRRVGLDGIMSTIINDGEPDWKGSGRGLWVSPDEQTIYYTHEFHSASGAVLKKWTPNNGIEIICDRSVGFLNPANMDVNPVDGKLYLTDRAEDDATKLAQGFFRIDGINQRTRLSGDALSPVAVDGELIANSFLEEPRGISFFADGSYFICGHKDGSIWFVDTAGVLHRYLYGLGKKDAYSLPDGQHPPLVDRTYFAQPRAVTLAPNGNLLVTCNDSGFVFRVDCIVPSYASDLKIRLNGGTSLLEWIGSPKRAYRIERALNLGLDSWDAVTAVQGANAVTQFVDPQPATGPRAFYRVLPSL